MNDKILSFLGLCRRAGKLVIGAEPATESVLNGKSRLIIYARDFSQTSAKHVLNAANAKGVTALMLNRNKDDLSLALGKLCGVLSIEDKGFADKLKKLIIGEQGGEFYDEKI